MASALVAACFAIFTKKISQSEPPMSLLFFELLGGFIGVTLLLPLYITIEPGTKLMPGAVDWIYLSCFAFFCTIGLYYFQIKSLEKISAFTLSLSYNTAFLYQPASDCYCRCRTKLPDGSAAEKINSAIMR